MLQKIKDGIQYGIGIAIGAILVNATLGLVYLLVKGAVTLLSLKAGMI